MLAPLPSDDLHGERTTMPNGGVSRPISMATMLTMPNQIGSKPSLTITGYMIGMVSSRIDTESMIMPSSRNTSDERQLR